jgi:BlaI family transcriptional regulator, penicillinase repressor
MPKRVLPQPTPAELEILQLLWRHGPSTVQQVKDRLERDVGYTTALKLLQIMTQKGLTSRNEVGRSHVYQAVAAEEPTKRRMVSDLLDRAFEGSAAGLVVQALSAKPARPDELRRIRELLDQLEEGD